MYILFCFSLRLKVALQGFFFNTATVRPIVFLPPTSSRIHLQRRHASYRCARPLPAKAGTSRSVIYENPLGPFTCHKAGTWDILFYFPSEGSYTEDYPDVRKIQRFRPGLNPRTRVPVSSMLTTRPPKPSLFLSKCFSCFLLGFFFSFSFISLPFSSSAYPPPFKY